MAIDFKKPSEVASQYLLHLKSLKPEVNTAQEDSDWWIRGQVIGGVMSGIYADQSKIADDAFPQSARHEALEKHLQLYFGQGFRDATQSHGNVLVSGATGSFIPTGTEFVYDANGNVYQSTEDVTLTAATASIPVISVNAGQDQNLFEGTELTLTSPPSGVDDTAEVYDGNISDGRDSENDEDAAQRILDFVRSPISGGKESDYLNWAKAADASVVDANVIRYFSGLGTVGIIITAGTTDIDTAIDNGDPVVLTPSQALIDTVQEYIDALNPITDCVTVYGPSEIEIDVELNVSFATGDGSTILSGQTLTQLELVEREIKRAIYKTPVGGRKIGASGYVVASEIEESIDFNLSSLPYTVGNKLQIIVDRQCLDLSATGANRAILGTEVAIPGTIVINEV